MGAMRIGAGYRVRGRKQRDREKGWS